MKNRVISLFELDELLGAATTRSRQGLKRAKPMSRARGRNAGAVVSQAFDQGEPIKLRYAEGQVRALCRPDDAFGGTKGGRARSEQYSVEAFEESDSTDEPEPQETESQEEEDAAFLAAIESESESEDSEAQSRRPARRGIPAPTPAHAAQLAAFEREIGDLTAHAKSQGSPSTIQGSPPIVPDDREAETAQMGTSAPEVRRGGHAIFDQMAQGMALAHEFRLPPVKVKKLFQDLDREIDRENERALARSRAEAVASSVETVSGGQAVALPADEVLVGDLAHLAPRMDPEKAGQVLAEQLGTGQLLHFTPEQLELDEEETRAVFAFFWPDMDLSTLGPISDQDRSFAQALLIEAADMSHAMGIVEGIYKTFFMKVPTSFGSVRNALLKLGKKAIEDGWFKKIKTVEQAEQAQIYESVRVTLQRNFATVMRLRRSTGELTGY